MSKSELRARLLAELRAFSPNRRAQASAEICQAVRAHPTWTSARLVCAFLPLPSEPQIAPLWEGDTFSQFCFPRVEGDDVVLIRIAEPAILRRTNWRFEAEELATAPTVTAAEVSLFLVPGLGFTPTGLRLGRGGGYYDRLLSRRSPASTAWGLCFPGQLVASLPAEPHDQHVDAVITGAEPAF